MALARRNVVADENYSWLLLEVVDRTKIVTNKSQEKLHHLSYKLQQHFDKLVMNWNHSVIKDKR